MFHFFSTAIRRTTRLSKLENLIIKNGKNSLGKHLKGKLLALTKDHPPKRRYGPTGENGSPLPPNGLNTARSIAMSPRSIFRQTTPHSPIPNTFIGCPFTEEDFIAVFGADAYNNNANADLVTLRTCLTGAFLAKKDEKKTNIQELLKRYKRSPNDTASPEIQIALLSLKIHDLEAHCIHSLGGKGHKDQAAKHSLTKARSQRLKMLNYLGKLSLERLHLLLDDLKLPTDVLGPSTTSTAVKYPPQWYSKERIFIKSRRLKQQSQLRGA